MVVMGIIGFGLLSSGLGLGGGFGCFTIGEVGFFFVWDDVPVDIIILLLIWRLLTLSTSHNIRYSFTDGHSTHLGINLFIIFLTKLKIKHEFHREYTCGYPEHNHQNHHYSYINLIIWSPLVVQTEAVVWGTIALHTAGLGTVKLLLDTGDFLVVQDAAVNPNFEAWFF